MTFTHVTETAFQKGQLGVESTWGVAVPATIALGSIMLTPSIKRTENKFTPRGILLPAIQSIGREHTEISIEGQASFEDLVYFLKDVVSDAQADPLSYTVEAGGLQVPGAVVTSITLKGNRDVIDVTGSMLGKKGVVQTPTAGLVVPTQTPILASPVVITIGGVQLAKCFEWEIAISDMWGGETYIGDSTLAAIMQKSMTATCRLKCEADETNLAFLSETEVQTIAISSANGSQSMAITFDAKFGEPGTFSDEGGIFSIDLNATIMNKATKAIAVTFA
jgi:hypothetical protein